MWNSMTGSPKKIVNPATAPRSSISLMLYTWLHSAPSRQM
jgi:hypothetical protein